VVGCWPTTTATIPRRELREPALGNRLPAVIILSGAEDTFQSYATEASRPDLLVVQSSPTSAIHALWRTALRRHSPVQQVVLELQTAHHLPPFDGVDAAALAW